MQTMFCLVSRQSMAQVLPVFMYKPKFVVLFATPEEKKSADNLEKLFCSKSISVIRYDGLDAYDYIKFKQFILQQLINIPENVCLNVTGGTKLMALAAYEAFAEKNKSIIYCDTVHKRIIQLFPEYNSTQLKLDLSIEDYFLSYGYEIVGVKDIKFISEYFNLFRYLESQNLFDEFINLNKIIREKTSQHQPRETILSPKKKIKYVKNFDNYMFFYGFGLKEKIKIDSSNFNVGNWLEYYTYYTLTEKLNYFALCGVKLISSEGVENEIDVISIKDFKLHLFSCKSGKSDNQFDLYQLETLRNITSGTLGKGIFITANKSSQKFLARAKSLSITVKNFNQIPEVFNEH